MLIPTVIDKTPQGDRVYDIYSRLLKNRIIFLGTSINSNISNSIVAQLLYLDAENPGKDIKLYINSPGGSVTAGLAIYDTMKHVKSDVSTICIGQAASMGSFLLSGGAKGKRFSLENSEILIHQIMGGAEGQASDIKIAAENIIKMKDRLNTILSENTGQKKEKIEKDADRDFYMTAKEAKEYGIIDKII